MTENNKAAKQLQKHQTNHFEHLHHTLAIEGNTMTIDEIQHFLERSVLALGKSIHEHQEVLWIDEASHFEKTSLSKPS